LHINKDKFEISAFGSGLNPRGALDFSPLYLFSKRKITLQGRSKSKTSIVVSE